MKIALVLPNSSSTAPYITYYIDYLKKGTIDFDVITWDRSNTEESTETTFKYEGDTLRNPLIKVISYYKFKQFVEKILLINNYDRVIVFSAQLGLALSSFLLTHYPLHYAIDIRDYSRPIYFFPKRFKKLLSRAGMVIISSPGFFNWLPSGRNYTLSHNIHSDKISKSQKEFIRPDNHTKPLVITTIGAIRDYEANIKFIKVLGNDESFLLKYIGEGPSSSALLKFTRDNQVRNVEFCGRYEKSSELRLLRGASFINILLNENKLSNHLLSNRLYLSALTKTPCLVNANTEQSRIVKKYNLGIVVQDYEQLPNLIEQYQHSFNDLEFLRGCQEFLQAVLKDEENFEEELKNFLTEK